MVDAKISYNIFCNEALISEMKWNGFSEKNSQKIRRQNYLYYCSTAQLIQHKLHRKAYGSTVVGSLCTAYIVIQILPEISVSDGTGKGV